MAVFADPDWRADLRMVARATQVAARQFAVDCVLLSSLAGRVPVPVGTGAGAIAWQSFVQEVGVARGLGARGAAHEVAVAVLLSRHLPRTLELLACGKVTSNRAQALATELLTVDTETAWQVDREICRSLPTLAPERIRTTARRLVDRIDADAAADRAAKAAAARGVRVRADKDGQAQAFITGPAVPLTRWHQALTEAAHAQKIAGDPRGLDALRFDLLVAGFTCDQATPSAAPAPPGPEAPAPPAAMPLSTPPLPAALPAAPPSSLSALPVSPSAEGDPDVLVAARAEAARLLWAARCQVERILAAAHTAEAESLAALQQARTEADRLTAQAIRDRLLRSTHTDNDRRLTRPVQLLVHVPVTTLLGLDDEPGYLQGYGWLSAPQCRQLLPLAELRQVCTTEDGRVLDLAERPVRPEPTPTGMRYALSDMSRTPFDLTTSAWASAQTHDPTPAMAELVRVRDRTCDGPLGTAVTARRCDLDHDRPWPAGPTAAWNLAARSRRAHRLKHAGWTPARTTTGTRWTSPAGQSAPTTDHRQPHPPLDPHARLPDPDQLHHLEAELLRPPTEHDDPPF